MDDNDLDSGTEAADTDANSHAFNMGTPVAVEQDARSSRLE